MMPRIFTNRTIFPMDTSKVTGIILAGWHGKSMGELDKGLQNFRGAPMTLHVLMRLAPQVADVMINANHNLGPYEGFGVSVWPNEIAGVSTALAGIQTGLLHCDTEFMVSVPCDAPFVPLNLVQQLAQGLQGLHKQQDADLSIAVTGAGATRQAHPLFCLMNSTLLEHLTQYLRAGGHELDAWHASLKVAEVHFDDEAAFRI